mgnify:CR=1 FL=1
MRNSKAKLLKRIHCSHMAGNLSSPDKDLSYKALKQLYGKGVPYGLAMFTPRHELVRQGNWS